LDVGPEGEKRIEQQSRWLAFTINLAVTGLAAFYLLATDDKKQAIGGVAVAAFLGSMAASLAVPAPIGTWLFGAPLVVGLVGYLDAWYMTPRGASLGAHLPTLLNASPLDYAGAGTAGAILGRWIGLTKERSTDLVLTGFGSVNFFGKRHQTPAADQAL
jgi:hypothetical protein